MTDLRRFRSGRSPFDNIMHLEDDGTEWWSAREMMPLLGYVKWDSMLAVIERARTSCRNVGIDPSSIFLDTRKYSEVVRRTGLDVQMLRYGCYMVAMNGDPNKIEIADAQRYFAQMTRAAEKGIAVPAAIVESPRPWSERFRQTIEPHVRFMYMEHPGCFTVITTLVGQMLSMEDELIRHMFQLKPSDRPDVSIGRCWSEDRKSRGLAPVDRFAPLRLPDQDRDVMLRVYADSERGTFEAWFGREYLRDKLPVYYDGKPEFRRHGELPSASAADNTCRRLTGRPANLESRLHRQLVSVGGFFPVGKSLPKPEKEQRGLFDDQS
jgi:hypothetical protein